MLGKLPLADHESEDAVDPKFIMQQFIWSMPIDPNNEAVDQKTRGLWRELAAEKSV